MFSRAVLLILLLCGTNSCSFGDRVQTLRSECNKTIHHDPLTDSNVTVDPYCDCRSSGVGVVRAISYNCAVNGCGRTHVDLSSACVRCSMCVAVAEKINQTLLEVHDMMAPNDWLNDTEAALLLRTICDHSFQNYGLREIDGKRLISDPTLGDKLIASSADGLWGDNLKTMCHEYLDEMQDLQLYKHWREWCEDEDYAFNLEDVLCKNEIGSLRDCRNINNIHRRQTSTRTNVDARVKILAEYSNYR
ncbi:uncharacterized protein LOC109856077 [Pseudomyrmex gracilis]|uniref:uncharacterized protein LOC109856077 n=1 Tax=Pseudomyrmex gracilis TaxID=219809 RepID=UPI0009956BF8|nr:uncharacterized protein LOC109856077 [Pseudomyrmex gracilis]